MMIVINGQTKAVIIILLVKLSFTSLSAQEAIVRAPPVENGDTAVDNPPKKIHA